MEFAYNEAVGSRKLFIIWREFISRDHNNMIMTCNPLFEAD